MGKLTAKQIENLAAPGTYEDGDGLRLFIKPNGKKYWVLRFQLAGKRREMGLGTYPAIGLKEARQKSSDQRRLLRDGIDPLQARDDERTAQQVAEHQRIRKSVTFQDVSNDYIEAHRAGWKNVKHAQQWTNTLATYAAPVIGDLATSQITTEHLLEILKPIWSSKAETASRVRNRIELVLDAAKARGLRDGENPARWRGHLDKLLPPSSKAKRTQNHPALPYSELSRFMQALNSVEGLSACALKMTILTACRTSEVLGADWSEVDVKTKLWTIPAARMKAGKVHTVPLSDALIALLEGLPRIKGSSLLFPGARKGRPISNMAMLMTLRRMDQKDLDDQGKGWRDSNDKVITAHGFRSTFRDWAAECTHYAREVCEMSLAHVVANGAEAAYWRSDLLEKRRTLMADWADFVTPKVNGAAIPE
ncbi:Prophage integrase IntS [Pseudomonas fluorescens]|uniref:Prophage integrase IntS n=1 Tax=Pseudomonas fluorescens TaxID=294 RepID=A0A5E7Q5H5_PSEFL|nr:integrase arm-type DNA-binding domain-containing protein [Pseudomonas fluorescens]VVP57376.1 Prophage integrase IntS [Pseudomonas fluorescens]